jgi:hypothetical protein
VDDQDVDNKDFEKEMETEEEELQIKIAQDESDNSEALGP